MGRSTSRARKRRRRRRKRRRPRSPKKSRKRRSKRKPRPRAPKRRKRKKRRQRNSQSLDNLDANLEPAHFLKIVTLSLLSFKLLERPQLKDYLEQDSVKRSSAFQHWCNHLVFV